jgi:cyclopropane-fatty-acyl-phospholipid synthase
MIADQFAQSAFLRALQAIREGRLELFCDGQRHQFGDPDSSLCATLSIHNSRFFRRALLQGDIGIGESWMDGDWTSPDLTAVIRLAVRNLTAVESGNSWFSALSRTADVLRHHRRANTIQGSRRNIRDHYDLNNEFFRLFLDQRMVYSCAWYETPEDTLETAQLQKLDRACSKLQLCPTDHLLEIGTGWGAMAIHAASRYGCRVTTTTISREQYEYAREQIAQAGLTGRIELLLEDYRHLKGRYDKLVSIEMFEAVGYEFYDTFFGACDRLLMPDGAMLLQAITINDRKFPVYRRRADWIQKYIFPGSELASVSGICASLARATGLSLFHAEDMGTHYARTLRAWSDRFHDALGSVRALGFDERFIRMWEFYLAYCEGAFLERHISDFQFLLAKSYCKGTLLNEPWDGASVAVSRREPASR